MTQLLLLEAEVEVLGEAYEDGAAKSEDDAVEYDVGAAADDDDATESDDGVAEYEDGAAEYEDDTTEVLLELNVEEEPDTAYDDGAT